MENEIKRLIEVNNQHLRAKAKLQEEMIGLKKQIINQDKNVALIETLQMQNAKLNAEITELKKQLSLAILQKQKATAEIERLNKLNWHQRLFKKYKTQTST